MTPLRTKLTTYINNLLIKTHEFFLFKMFNFGPPLGICRWKSNPISFGSPNPKIVFEKSNPTQWTWNTWSFDPKPPIIIPMTNPCMKPSDFRSPSTLSEKKCVSDRKIRTCRCSSHRLRRSRTAWVVLDPVSSNIRFSLCPVGAATHNCRADRTIWVLLPHFCFLIVSSAIPSDLSKPPC
jgi:hypothetical protein